MVTQRLEFKVHVHICICTEYTYYVVLVHVLYNCALQTMFDLEYMHVRTYYDTLIHLQESRLL